MNGASKIIRNEKGMAALETLPVLIVFLLFLAYSFGMYGIIQTGILNSIGARVYAFETFRNRTDLTYFITTGKMNPQLAQYASIGNRFHLVDSEMVPNAPSDKFPASERPLAMGLTDSQTDENRTQQFHNSNLQGNNPTQITHGGVAPVWIRVGYGICLNMNCGD